MVRCGTVGQGGRGEVRSGMIRSVKAVWVWYGEVRYGQSWRSRLGASGLGLVRRSWRGKVWLGGAW